MEESNNSEAARVLDRSDLVLLQQSISITEAILNAQELNQNSNFIEAKVACFRNISIYIHANEGHHKEPHFHATINGLGNASYSIRELKWLPAKPIDRKLARFEHNIINWAKRAQPQLIASWEESAAGRRPFWIEI
jgi:hypothetical protein